MKIQLNPWWLLPLTTLVIGAVAGQWYSKITTTGMNNVLVSPPLALSVAPKEEIAKVTANESLNVVKVALPPAPPLEYKPQLTATLVNNEVVLEQQTREKVTTNLDTSEAETIDQVPQDTLLAQRFNQVLADMEQESTQPQAVLHPQPLTRYPQWYQDLVPPLEFSEHIYSSKDNESRVRVNNQVVKEGELIDDKMRIVKIEPQQVIIQLQQRQFSLPALSRW